MAQRDSPTKKVKRKKEKKVIAEPGVSNAPQQHPDTIPAEPWNWISLSPTKDQKHTAAFSNDGLYFFLPADSAIQIYSALTLKVVSTLSSPMGGSRTSSSKLEPSHCHKMPVTALALNPGNPLQLYSASLDGTIKIWDWMEGTLLKSVDSGHPITHMCAHANSPDAVFLGVFPRKEPESPTGDTQRLAILSLKSVPGKTSPPVVIFKGKLRHRITALSISPDGQWLVATGGSTLHVAMTTEPTKQFTKIVSTHHLTCLAFHPTKDYLATGDVLGQVRLWYCIGSGGVAVEHTEGGKKAPTTLFHWHAHPVEAITFTPNGSYLLSGGLESTLVLWQLETSHKGFVPRLGASIQGVAVLEAQDRGQEIIANLSNGEVVAVSISTLKVRARNNRIQIINPESTNHPPILAIHPQLHWLALTASHPASIQIYDPHTASTITTIEVSPSNRVTSSTKHAILAPSVVSHAAFSPSGRWLATTDIREATLDIGATAVLKFWSWAGSSFVLNTKIDKPHGSFLVTDLTFSPTSRGTDVLLATSGGDAKVRLWGVKSLATEKSPKESVEVWLQRFTLTYRREIPSRLAFSPDGSLVAVVHGLFVTLWSRSTFRLIQTLSLNAAPASPITFTGPSGRYLVLTNNSRQLVVWDLVYNRVTRRILLESSAALLSKEENRLPFVFQLQNNSGFGVGHLAGQSTLLDFYDFENPMMTSRRTLPFRCHVVSPLPPSLHTSAALATIADDGRVALIGESVSLPPQEGDTERALSRQAHNRLSLFEDVFGRSAFRDPGHHDADSEADPTELDMGGVRTSFDLRLLDGPAYLLPPIETLYLSLMDRVLLKNQRDRVDEDAHGGDTYSQAMDIDNTQPELTQTTENLGHGIDSRIVGDAEIDMLVALFAEHTAVHDSAKQANPPHTDISYSSEKRINGFHSTPVDPIPSVRPLKKAMPAKVISPRVQGTFLAAADSNQVRVGQKRKKAGEGRESL